MQDAMNPRRRHRAPTVTRLSRSSLKNGLTQPPKENIIEEQNEIIQELENDIMLLQNDVQHLTGLMSEQTKLSSYSSPTELRKVRLHKNILLRMIEIREIHLMNGTDHLQPSLTHALGVKRYGDLNWNSAREGSKCYEVELHIDLFLQELASGGDKSALQELIRPIFKYFRSFDQCFTKYYTGLSTLLSGSSSKRVDDVAKDIWSNLARVTTKFEQIELTVLNLIRDAAPKFAFTRGLQFSFDDSNKDVGLKRSGEAARVVTKLKTKSKDKELTYNSKLEKMVQEKTNSLENRIRELEQEIINKEEKHTQLMSSLTAEITLAKEHLRERDATIVEIHTLRDSSDQANSKLARFSIEAVDVSTNTEQPEVESEFEFDIQKPDCSDNSTNTNPLPMMVSIGCGTKTPQLLGSSLSGASEVRTLKADGTITTHLYSELRKPSSVMIEHLRTSSNSELSTVEKLTSSPPQQELEAVETPIFPTFVDLDSSGMAIEPMMSEEIVTNIISPSIVVGNTHLQGSEDAEAVCETTLTDTTLISPIRSFETALTLDAAAWLNNAVLSAPPDLLRQVAACLGANNEQTVLSALENRGLEYPSDEPTKNIVTELFLRKLIIIAEATLGIKDIESIMFEDSQLLSQRREMLVDYQLGEVNIIHPQHCETKIPAALDPELLLSNTDKPKEIVASTTKGLTAAEVLAMIVKRKLSINAVRQKFLSTLRQDSIPISEIPTSTPKSTKKVAKLKAELLVKEATKMMRSSPFHGMDLSSPPSINRLRKSVKTAISTFRGTATKPVSEIPLLPSPPKAGPEKPNRHGNVKQTPQNDKLLDQSTEADNKTVLVKRGSEQHTSVLIESKDQMGECEEPVQDSNSKPTSDDVSQVTPPDVVFPSLTNNPATGETDSQQVLNNDDTTTQPDDIFEGTRSALGSLTHRRSEKNQKMSYAERHNERETRLPMLKALRNIEPLPELEEAESEDQVTNLLSDVGSNKVKIPIIPSMKLLNGGGDVVQNDLSKLKSNRPLGLLKSVQSTFPTPAVDEDMAAGSVAVAPIGALPPTNSIQVAGAVISGALGNFTVANRKALKKMAK